jgi:hypothetical protein
MSVEARGNGASILSLKQIRLGKLTSDLTIDWFDQYRNCGTSALRMMVRFATDKTSKTSDR